MKMKGREDVTQQSFLTFALDGLQLKIRVPSDISLWKRAIGINWRETWPLPWPLRTLQGGRNSDKIPSPPLPLPTIEY